ncbi:hypothetical protein WH47_06903 [Habropoda laboriosa]|uniref:Histone-lysine N-methyltransferase SETMAR n=1 Tax=Habropoda laboriosa TaxID=597456 RepID=A0A0L7QQ50_9HYME|nr:hypothetical protein WH47_06903 [Habropoda laboriosa]
MCARTVLDRMIKERWIGRRGTVRWPARSPDLTPLDFIYGVNYKVWFIVRN